MKIDLSQFKVKHKDENSATLVHPDGHEFKVAVKALHPLNRNNFDKLEKHEEPKVKKMADGGKVPDKGPKVDPQKAKEIQAGATQSGYQPHQWAANLKEGLGMADGGEVSKEDSKLEEILKATGAPTETPQESPMPQSTGVQQGADAQAEQAMGVVPTPKPTTPVVPTAEPTTVPPIAPQPDMAPVVAPPAANPLASNMAQQGSSIDQSFGNQMQGQKELSQAEGALGNRQANILHNQAIQQKASQDEFVDKLQNIDADVTQATRALQDGHIDPQHWWNNKSTEGKIATSIGLLISGIGAGLGHTDNMAMKYMDAEIGRDIDAQKAELGKRENLLGANMKRYGNLQDATNMTRLQNSELVKTKLEQAAAQSGDPAAKARAKIAIGQIQQQELPLKQSLAMNQAMIGAAAKDSQQGGGTTAQEAMLPYLRQINPEKAKEIETRLVPGVGMAQIPVTSEVRNTITAKQTLDKMGKEFYDWAAQHSGSLDPKQIAIGKTKAAELQSLYRNSINGGVFKKGEQEFIDNIVDSDPTKFFNSMRVLPKLKEVVNSNASQLNTLKKSVGLPSNSGTAAAQLDSKQQSFVNWAKKNPNDPRSAVLLKKLGIE